MSNADQICYPYTKGAPDKILFPERVENEATDVHFLVHPVR